MSGWTGIVAAITAFLLAAYPSATRAPIVTRNLDYTAAATSSLPIKKETAATTPKYAENYRVVKVVDGDTLSVEKDGTVLTLRLIGLDTPETVDPRTTVQCFGSEASSKAKELLFGKFVRLEFDSSQGQLDKYGRTLAYVYLPDGRNFNKLMIAEGYGYEYTYNIPYKYRDEFRAAENSARENSIGLWASSACEGLERAPEPPDTPRPIIVPIGGQYKCAVNTYDCASFKTRTEAQKAFDACGGAANDIHWLDGDKDGDVCESLP